MFPYCFLSTNLLYLEGVYMNEQRTGCQFGLKWDLDQRFGVDICSRERIQAMIRYHWIYHHLKFDKPFPNTQIAIDWIFVFLMHTCHPISMFPSVYLFVSLLVKTCPIFDCKAKLLRIIYPLIIEHSSGKWPIYRWFT